MTTHYVDNLEQARLLADPFKLKLLEAFATTPRTTKQVADSLGEKAPKLYRHVDALAAGGLIELVEERPKRGTVERYYRTVATRFELAPQLVAEGRGQVDEAEELVLSMLRETSNDLSEVIRRAAECPDTEHPPLIMQVSVQAGREQVDRLRRLLMEWIAECEALADQPGSDEDTVKAAGLVTFYER